MTKLLAAGNLFLEKMDLTDVALLKFCVGALGILLGLGAAKHHKKSVGVLAGLVFLVSAIPLVGKFFMVITNTED